MAKEITEETLKKEEWCPAKNNEECCETYTCLKCLKQHFEKESRGKVNEYK